MPWGPLGNVAYSYLNWQGCPSFIGGSYVYLHTDGKIKGSFAGGTRRTSMGLLKDGSIYLHLAETSRTVPSMAEEAVAGWDGATAASMPTIRRGAKGDAVKTLQKKLGGLVVDGDFGPKTETSVKAFQKGKTLVVDGIVGPKTWVALGV